MTIAKKYEYAAVTENRICHDCNDDDTPHTIVYWSTGDISAECNYCGNVVEWL